MRVFFMIRIKAFLDGVDVKDMVVFDMNSEYVAVSVLCHV